MEGPLFFGERLWELAAAAEDLVLLVLFFLLLVLPVLDLLFGLSVLPPAPLSPLLLYVFNRTVSERNCSSLNSCSSR